jgi:hypothetical protein
MSGTCRYINVPAASTKQQRQNQDRSKMSFHFHTGFRIEIKIILALFSSTVKATAFCGAEKTSANSQLPLDKSGFLVYYNIS